MTKTWPPRAIHREDADWMLVVILMLAGFAFMFSRELASKIAKGILGVVLVLTAITYAIRSLVCFTLGSENTGTSLPSGALLTILMLAALALVGLVAWSHRADRAKAREIWARRHGSPRARSLPLAPMENQPNKVHPEK